MMDNTSADNISGPKIEIEANEVSTSETSAIITESAAISTDNVAAAAPAASPAPEEDEVKELYSHMMNSFREDVMKQYDEKTPKPEPPPPDPKSYRGGPLHRQWKDEFLKNPYGSELSVRNHRWHNRGHIPFDKWVVSKITNRPMYSKEEMTGVFSNMRR